MIKNIKHSFANDFSKRSQAEYEKENVGGSFEGGGCKGLVAPPFQNYWGGGAGPPCPPPSSYAYLTEENGSKSMFWFKLFNTSHALDRQYLYFPLKAKKGVVRHILVFLQFNINKPGPQ